MQALRQATDDQQIGISLLRDLLVVSDADPDENLDPHLDGVTD